MTPVSYGIWDRCEYTNVSIIKQGVTVGYRSNVQFCYPNRYMRYSPESYQTCNHWRRSCPVLSKEKIPEGCSCRYLPSGKALQWLTVLAAIFLGLGLLLLYLKTITAPENSSSIEFEERSIFFFSNLLMSFLDSAAIVLGYGPFICFLLALLLMVTGLIVFAACKSFEKISLNQSIIDDQI